MALPAHVRPEAKAELYSAAAWYRDRAPRQALWLDLLDEFDMVLSLVRENPEMFIRWDGSVRRAILRRFPYAIYYEPEPDRIVVLRFLPMAQEERQGP